MDVRKQLAVVGVAMLALFSSGIAFAQEKDAKALPDKMTIDLGGGAKMEFVLIHPGSFMMGSDNGDAQEKPVHEVKITKPFYMGVCEVTQAQWLALMGDNPSSFWGNALPVQQVSWEDCRNFLVQLKERVGEGLTCRLPTEAEWEYACRAGSKTEYCFGDDRGPLGEYAWCQFNSKDQTHPVGQKKPNVWGLYDMHGNVYEWCADWYAPYGLAAATDPKGPDSGNARVVRGGSWSNRPPRDCRSADRGWDDPTSRNAIYGLRVVCGL